MSGNDAEIGDNVNMFPNYYITYPRIETKLTKGMKITVTALTLDRTNELSRNGLSFGTFDYIYSVLIDGKQVVINGWFLDFSDSLEYRSKLSGLK